MLYNQWTAQVYGRGWKQYQMYTLITSQPRALPEVCSEWVTQLKAKLPRVCKQVWATARIDQTIQWFGEGFRAAEKDLLVLMAHHCHLYTLYFSVVTSAYSCWVGAPPDDCGSHHQRDRDSDPYPWRQGHQSAAAHRVSLILQPLWQGNIIRAHTHTKTYWQKCT